MTEILSQEESAIFHYKDSELVAITHSNGSTKLLKVTGMMQKDIQEFYETRTTK